MNEHLTNDLNVENPPIYVSEVDWNMLVNMLENPRPANEELKKLMELGKQLTNDD